MTTTPSRISTTIALDGAGRRFGHYRIPHSDNTQPYGHVGPIAVLANGDGPTLVLTGGVHGDEYAGPVAIMRLAHELGLDDLNGRLILLPALNAPAVTAASRCSPLDGGNLNRAFPGNPDGGPTAMIAHWLETQVLAHCDGAIDFHSGGRASDYEPVVMVNASPGDLFARNMTLARAFGVELIWVLGEMNDNRSVNAAAQRVGVPMFACELGGKGESSPAMIDIAMGGALGVMRQMGILDDGGEVPEASMRMVEATGPACAVNAPHSGFFDPAVEIGVDVSAGGLAGWIRDPFEIQRPPTRLCFEIDGHLVTRCSRGYVQAAEKLFGLVTNRPA